MRSHDSIPPSLPPCIPPPPLQTAAFYKEDGNGETAWHSDLNTAPFDSNDMVTFWLALTDVPGAILLPARTEPPPKQQTSSQC